MIQRSVPTPYQSWVTMTEFARIMGRTPQWAYKGARMGNFSDFGIAVLQDHTSSPGSRRRWYFRIPNSFLQ